MGVSAFVWYVVGRPSTMPDAGAEFPVNDVSSCVGVSQSCSSQPPVDEKSKNQAMKLPTTLERPVTRQLDRVRDLPVQTKIYASVFPFHVLVGTPMGGKALPRANDLFGDGLSGRPGTDRTRSISC